MFSILSAENQARVPITVAIVLASLLLALALSLMAVAQVLHEYRMLGRWIERPGHVPIAEIEALRQEIGARIIVRSGASAILLLCTVATLWLQQRQLAVRRTLLRVKLLAHNILSSLNQGVVTTDGAGIITSINPAAGDLIGASAECIGRPIAHISSAEVPLAELCRSVTERRGMVSDLDLTVEGAGRVRRLVASALELKDARGAAIGCVIHLRDVTERMLMKEQVWRMEQFASLSTLASGLHHEIKNPLTALSIHVQLLEERLLRGPADGPTAEMIGVLKAEIRRLNNTLSSFRDYASLERLSPRPVDLRRDVLEGVARLIAPQAARQDVLLDVSQDGPPLPGITLDPEKIEQAVLNLMLNALEAMPEGGKLTLGAGPVEGGVCLRVRDTGAGIAAEVQDHVLRPYFSTKGGGTGMGLTLAEKLVRQHGGRLDFRTGPGGTTFSITLPLGGPDGPDGPP